MLPVISSSRRSLLFSLPGGLWLLLLLLALRPGDARAATGNEKPRTIRVVMDDAYPPYIFRTEEGKLQGILVDQWQAWEKNTGIRAEITGMAWGEAMRRMHAGEFDVIDTIFETAERRKYLAFTPSYASVEVPIFFRKNISGITDLESLRGFSVAAKSGDNAADLLKEKGLTTVLLFPNYEAIVEAAREHKINAFVVDAPPAYYYLNKLGLADEFRQTAPINAGEFHRAVSREDAALLHTVTAGFAAIGSAELRRIDEKWLGRPITDTRYFTYASYVVAGALLLIAGLFASNRALRKLVLRRTAAQRESEQQFRQLAENIREVFWLTDPAKQQMLYISPAYEEIWGRTCASLYAAPMHWLEAIHPEDRERVRQAVMSEQTAGSYDMEFRITRPDGVVRWIHDRAFPVRNSTGAVYRIAGVAEDITARKQTEEAQRRHAEQLARETARLVAAQAVAKVGSWETNVATGEVSWSEETHRIFETDPGRFHPTHPAFVQLVHPEDRVLVDEAFVRSLSLRTPCSLEHRLLLPDGHAKMVEERWQVFFDEQGRPVRAVGTCQDITDRKKADAALRESEERFRAIFEQAGIGIALVGPLEGRILRCNRVLAEMLGYGVEELCGLTVQDISHPGDYIEDRAQGDAMIAGKISRFQMEKRYRGKDGQLVWGLLTSTVVRDPDGKALFVIGMVEAIADRKRAETELRASEQQLHALVGRLNTIREEEAKRIARELHDDLGQQLTALNMDISHLQARPAGKTPNVQAELVRMRTGVDHMIESVQKIAGELRLGQLDLLGLPAAIETELKEFERRAGLRCAISRLDEVPGLDEVLATAVFRIMQEALTNIARHAGADRVELSLRAEPGELILEIRDNGRGITAAQLVDRQAFGLLGMRERAEALGGKFSIAGQPGQGTVIQVNLPVPPRA